MLLCLVVKTWGTRIYNEGAGPIIGLDRVYIGTLFSRFVFSGVYKEHVNIQWRPHALSSIYILYIRGGNYLVLFISVKGFHRAPRAVITPHWLTM